MTELSRRLLVSNGNTTTVVDRLELDGLVTRTPSAADRRVVHVALTDEPAGGTSSGSPPITRLSVDSLFSGVSSSDLDALEELLQRLTPRKASIP